VSRDLPSKRSASSYKPNCSSNLLTRYCIKAASSSFFDSAETSKIGYSAQNNLRHERTFGDLFFRDTCQIAHGLPVILFGCFLVSIIPGLLWQRNPAQVEPIQVKFSSSNGMIDRSNKARSHNACNMLCTLGCICLNSSLLSGKRFSNTGAAVKSTKNETNTLNLDNTTCNFCPSSFFGRLSIENAKHALKLS